jgi:hypothetical protein
MRNLIRGLIAALLLGLLSMGANAGVIIGVSVDIAPPVLPVYVQPEIPAPGYIWTPGYWAWAPPGYYWVPGAWVLPPAVGLLWTPGYWGWVDGEYLWYAGYWGPHVGFYGGINYGCGYEGVGYVGGYWRGNEFLYNRSVNNVRNINVTHVYERPVVNNAAVSRVSFNGGAGGIVARPSAVERAATREQHVAFTSAQRAHENLARGNTALRAAVNGGHPPVAATPGAGTLSGHGVVAAREPRGNPGTVSPQVQNDRRAQYAGASQAGYAHPGREPPGGGHPPAPTPRAGTFSGHGVVATPEPRGNPGTVSPQVQNDRRAQYAGAPQHAAAPQGGYPPSGHEPPGGGHPGGHEQHEGRGHSGG